MSSKICVIGSSNIDQIAYTKNIPADGETLFGDSFQMGFGGKGANQAVMAGLLGADVYMITCLGDDVYKEMTINNYEANNVNTDHIQLVKGASGVAPIWVDALRRQVPLGGSCRRSPPARWLQNPIGRTYLHLGGAAPVPPRRARRI